MKTTTSAPETSWWIFSYEIRSDKSITLSLTWVVFDDLFAWLNPNTFLAELVVNVPNWNIIAENDAAIVNLLVVDENVTVNVWKPPLAVSIAVFIAVCKELDV